MPKQMTKIPDKEYYVPFWIVLNYLDNTPPDPFIRVQLIEVTKTPVIDSSVEGTQRESVSTCTVQILPGVMARDIPLSYLLHKDDLTEWGQRIAQWFTDYVEQECNNDKEQ